MSVTVVRRLRAAARRDLRQAEVQNLGVAALGDKNVGRLDVAVNDALGVGGIERVGDLDGQRQQRLRCPAVARDACFSVRPSRNSMAMKACAVLVVNFVDGADVGMIQGGSSLGFALEAG